MTKPRESIPVEIYMVSLGRRIVCDVSRLAADSVGSAEQYAVKMPLLGTAIVSGEVIRSKGWDVDTKFLKAKLKRVSLRQKTSITSAA